MEEGRAAGGRGWAEDGVEGGTRDATLPLLPHMAMGSHHIPHHPEPRVRVRVRVRVRARVGGPSLASNSSPAPVPNPHNRCAVALPYPPTTHTGALYRPPFPLHTGTLCLEGSCRVGVRPSVRPVTGSLPL